MTTVGPALQFGPGEGLLSATEGTFFIKRHGAGPLVRSSAEGVEINGVVMDRQSYRELVDLAFPWWAFWRRGKNSLYRVTRKQ